MRKRIIIAVVCVVCLLLTAAVSVGLYLRQRSGDKDTPIAAVPTPQPPADQSAAPAEDTPEPVSAFMVAPASLGDISVTALFSTDRGVAVDTSFLIQTHVKTTRDNLQQNLSLHDGEINTAFTLTANTADEYLLTPDECLAYDHVYTLRYQPPQKHPLSVAFQTERGFGVVATLPAAERTYIPVDSGIEITFNESLTNNLADYFTIRPAVNGYFTQVGETYIFVPEALAYDTRYTVTIKGGENGVHGESGRTLSEDYVFAFATEWGSDSHYFYDIFGDPYETFLPDDDVFIEMNVSPSLTDAVYTVDVYQVPPKAENATHAFIEGEAAYAANSGSPPDFVLLESFESKLAVNPGQAYQRNQYFILTEKTYAPGHYLFDIHTKWDDQTFAAQKWIQVSALSVYSLSVSGELCLWVNNTADGQPVSGASVLLAESTGTAAATIVATDPTTYTVTDPATYTVTDEDGIAMLDTGAQTGQNVIIEAAGHTAFVYRIQTYDPIAIEPSRRYYHYMYTDRKAYLPNDTVQVFGALAARYPAYALGPADTVTLRLGDMIELPVTVDGYGAFQAPLPVSGLYGGVSLQLCVNGEVIDQKYISFIKYNREKYIVSAHADRDVYWVDETITVDFSVTTFDGAPVENVTLQGSFPHQTILTTDAGGLASGTMTASQSYGYNDWYDWRPGYTGLWFTQLSEDNYSQSVSVPVVVIPAQIMLEHENTGETAITFTASQIDRDALAQHVAVTGGPSTYGYLDPDVYRGAPTDLDFTLTVEKQTTTRIKTGESYDFIQKKTIPTYEYQYETTVYGHYTARTINGRGVIDNLPVSHDPMVSYSGYVTYDDPTGKTVKFYVTIGADPYYYANSTTRAYYFVLDRPVNAMDEERAENAADSENAAGTENTTGTENAATSINTNSQYNSLRLNETGFIRLAAYDAPEQEQISQGRVITIKARNAILTAATGDPGGVPLTFTPDCIYNVFVFGAYFDGRYVYPVEYPLYVNYDYSEKNLHVDMTFDKDAYAPGETVEAALRVTDEGGNPVRARVNLCVTDDAVLRLYPNDPYFLSGYYSSAYADAYPWTVYTSYTRHDGNGFGGAEMGEGGDDYDMRRDFNDNPVFETYETDANGELKLSFDLADAVTTWRVIVHGITQAQQIGDAQYYVSATLPYYMDLVMPDTYLTGDDIAVLVKSHGAQYRLNQTSVSYKAELYRNALHQSALDQGALIETRTNDSNTYILFNFGPQPAGDYLLRVYGEATGADGATYRDAMEKPITVADKDLPLSLSDRITIDDDHPTVTKAYDITASPVSVTFTNGDIADMMRILLSCANGGSSRTDYIAGTAYAAAFLRREPGDEPVRLTGSELPDIQQSQRASYGGISELTYGAPDIFYTARFTAAFPDVPDKDNLREYVKSEAGMYEDPWNQENSPVTPASGDPETEAKRAAGYLTLAALRDNVLLEIYGQIAILQNDGDPSPYSDTYYGRLRILLYAAALCAIGDDPTAAMLFNKYPASEAAYRHDDPAESRRRRETLDALTLYIKTTIDPQKAFETLKSQTESQEESQTERHTGTQTGANMYVSTVCERINFIKKAVPLTGTASTVQYTLHGETHTLNLVNFECRTLSITKAQYEALQITQINGKTNVNIAFTGSPDNLDESLSTLRLEKEITPVEGYANIYKVTFTVHLSPEGAKDSRWQYFTIRDRIPSNMRYTKPGFWSEANNMLVTAENQYATLSIWTDGQSDAYEYTYYLLRVSDAEAVIPPAYISQHYSLSEHWGVSR